MPNALIVIANGTEEMEAVITVDVLRRAKWQVTVAGLGSSPVTASRGVKLVPDVDWADIDPMTFEALILPGGVGGTDAFIAHDGLQETLRVFDAAGKWICAICAAPLALQQAGILEGRRVTCYPSAGESLTSTSWDPGRVVIDGNLITSQGPGTAFEFALTLIATIDSPDLALEVEEALILPGPVVGQAIR